MQPAGYSGTPLAKKLGIKDGSKVGVINMPESFLTLLAAPSGADIEGVTAVLKSAYDVLLFFTKSRQELEASFQTLAEGIVENGGLWICWPKKASKVPTDLDENVIRDIGLAQGLVDNKVCAVSEVWSGLRFVKRLKDRQA